MKKTAKKKVFSGKDKAEALRLLQEEGLTYKAVADKFGCSTSALTLWKRELGTRAKVNVSVKKSEPPKEEIVKEHSQPILEHEPQKPVQPAVPFEEVVKEYWGEGTRAADILQMSPDVSLDMVRFVHEAMQHVYDRLQD